MNGAENTPDLDALAARAATARRAHVALEKAGGLISLTEIAERWGVGKQTVRNHYERRDGFPNPVATHGRTDLWLTAEIDHWRATPRRRGRPPQAPRT